MKDEAETMNEEGGKSEDGFHMGLN